jgi:hypothetical protein
MRAHVIENGIVVNTILVDSLDFMPNLVEATEGSIGWLFDGQTYTNPNPPVVVEPPPAPTKEELLAQLQALTAKIEALE